MICSKCVNRLRRKQHEGVRFHMVDGIVAAHKKRSFLQIKNFRKVVPVGFNRHGKGVGTAGKGFNRRVQDIAVFKKILQRKSPPSGKKNIQYFSGNISFGKIEMFYFYTVALYHNEMKIDTMAKAFEREKCRNLLIFRR